MIWKEGKLRKMEKGKWLFGLELGDFSDCPRHRRNSEFCAPSGFARRSKNISFYSLQLT